MIFLPTRDNEYRFTKGWCGMALCVGCGLRESPAGWVSLPDVPVLSYAHSDVFIYYGNQSINSICPGLVWYKKHGLSIHASLPHGK